MSMETNSIDGYARAFLAVVEAEGDAERLSDELLSVALGFAESEELEGALRDPLVPVERKHGIVSDLIGRRVSPVTMALVNMLVGLNRLGDLVDITKRMKELAAEAAGHVLAEVHSPIELDEATRNRLAARLSELSGKQVELNVIVDPHVVGGLVAQVEDTLYDGSVRSRLQELREVWG
jgi:F-type H+-transporting ATPase subunit delta